MLSSKENTDFYKDRQIYLDGLAELQKVNPKLEFYGGDIAREYFNEPKVSQRLSL